jgi:uncharacterized membrane-anchored protein
MFACYARGMVPSASASPTISGRALLRVPEITVYFWIVKSLTTAMGEAASDYLVRVMHPVPAVLLGFVGFVVAIALQFLMRRYLAWTYWFAVAMVGVFGTMAADVLHVGFGVPYVASATFFAVLLAVVFVLWQKTEKTLSIHSINSLRREAFYWAVVVATFALGTALGDMTAATLHLGYFLSVVLFAVIIAIPAIGYWRFRWNPVFAFWFAYVATRPLGASLADWVGRPVSSGGVGWGEGRLSLLLTVIIICFVAYLAATRKDVQGDQYRREDVVLPKDRIETPEGIARFTDGVVRASVRYHPAGGGSHVIVDAPDFVSVILCERKEAERLDGEINQAALIGGSRSLPESTAECLEDEGPQALEWPMYYRSGG